MTKLLTRASLLAGLFAGAVLFAGGCNKAEPVAENRPASNPARVNNFVIIFLR